MLSIQPHLSSLKELIYRELVPVPKELARHLTNKKKSSKPEVIRAHEQELFAKLYLYDKIVKSSDIHELPEEVADEVKQNQLECLILLLYFQLINRDINGANYSARSILDDELAHLTEVSRTFLAEQLVELVVVSDDDAALRVAEDSIGGLTDDERLKRIVDLALLKSDYSIEQPQAIVTSLRDIAKGKDEPGVAACYLLSQIYEQLKLPFEEMDCYSQWVISLAEVYGRSASELAGVMCKRRNLGMERAIVNGAIRRVYLLTASEKYTEANKIVEEFKRAGYTDEMSMLKVNESRDNGYQCKFVSKDVVTNGRAAKGILYDLLLNSPRKNACVIVRDEHTSDVEKYPVALGLEVENEILKQLPSLTSRFSVSVIPEAIEENLIETRKWIVCYDVGNPISAVAVGILSVGAFYSVAYSRAIVFETRVNQEKDENWLSTTIGLLAEPFDHQKLDGIREAIKRIAEQLAPSREDVRVIQV